LPRYRAVKADADEEYEKQRAENLEMDVLKRKRSMSLKKSYEKRQSVIEAMEEEEGEEEDER